MDVNSQRTGKRHRGLDRMDVCVVRNGVRRASGDRRPCDLAWGNKAVWGFALRYGQIITTQVWQLDLRKLSWRQERHVGRHHICSRERQEKTWTNALTRGAGDTNQVKEWGPR